MTAPTDDNRHNVQLFDRPFGRSEMAGFRFASSDTHQRPTTHERDYLELNVAHHAPGGLVTIDVDVTQYYAKTSRVASASMRMTPSQAKALGRRLLELADRPTGNPGGIRPREIDLLDAQALVEEGLHRLLHCSPGQLKSSERRNVCASLAWVRGMCARLLSRTGELEAAS